MDALSSLLIAMSAFMAAPAAPVATPITLHYEERAPYLVRSGDGVHGLTADPAAQAFLAAGVPFVWEASSMSRQWHLMRESGQPHCVVGWYKNRERLGFAKFTKPIYRDGAPVALARRQFVFGPGRSLEGVLSTPGLRVLVRSRYTYGAYIEQALRRVAPNLVASQVPNVQLSERLLGNRADLMFASEEEAALLLRRLAGRAGQLQVLRFTDSMPATERHIACNRQVADAVIARLNGAITFQ